MLTPVGAQIPKFGESQLVCVHWKTFPPEAAVLEAIRGESIAQLRADKTIDEASYQRYLVWKRICGLLRMDKRKCRYCTHCRRFAPPQTLTKLDGSCPVPLLDIPTQELMFGRYASRPRK